MKRTFLLLEILLAIGLIALFAPILMKLTVNHYAKQVGRLEAFERQRIADWTFSEIKEQMLRQEIPWRRLPTEGQSMILRSSQVKLEIPGLESKEVLCTCKLTCRKEKENKRKELCRRYKVEISFALALKKEEKYTYFILVYRTPPVEKQD